MNLNIAFALAVGLLGFVPKESKAADASAFFDQSTSRIDSPIILDSVTVKPKKIKQPPLTSSQLRDWIDAGNHQTSKTIFTGDAVIGNKTVKELKVLREKSGGKNIAYELFLVADQEKSEKSPSHFVPKGLWALQVIDEQIISSDGNGETDDSTRDTLDYSSDLDGKLEWVAQGVEKYEFWGTANPNSEQRETFEKLLKGIFTATSASSMPEFLAWTNSHEGYSISLDNGGISFRKPRTDKPGKIDSGDVIIRMTLFSKDPADSEVIDGVRFKIVYGTTYQYAVTRTGELKYMESEAHSAEKFKRPPTDKDQQAFEALLLKFISSAKRP